MLETAVVAFLVLFDSLEPGFQSSVDIFAWFVLELLGGVFLS